MVPMATRNFTTLEVNMAQDMTLEELSLLAALAGLRLSADELQRLLPGVNRSHRQARELRVLVADTTEPAGVFSARKAKTP